MKNVLGIILGGGRGTRLYPLTQIRCKPAVPLGGKHRLIDIPLSNCINSEIRKIFVMTQFRLMASTQLALNDLLPAVLSAGWYCRG